jgi:hypothetical protein
VRPYLGEVERVVPVLADIAFRHDLHREFAALDRFEQIALMGLAVMGLAVVGDLFGGFGVGPVLDALHGLEVKLDPVALISGVDERIGVRAETVDVAIALRQAAVRHQDGDLMQALWRQRPEIPHRGRRAQVGPRVALLGVDEVGKFQGIPHEEHRRVVADDVPVSLCLQRSPAVSLVSSHSSTSPSLSRGFRCTCRRCRNAKSLWL